MCGSVASASVSWELCCCIRHRRDVAVNRIRVLFSNVTAVI